MFSSFKKIEDIFDDFVFVIRYSRCKWARRL